MSNYLCAGFRGEHYGILCLKSMNLILKNLENNYSFASFKQNMGGGGGRECISRFGCGSKFVMNKYIYNNVLTNFMTT
jgi:hypothetical protein